MNTLQAELPFDGDDEQFESPDLHEETGDNPEAYRFRYPLSFEQRKHDVQASIMAQAALRQETAYEDLGGNFPEIEPLDSILLKMTSQHTDLIEMFEHLDVTELVTHGGYLSMTKEDRAVYEVHFARLMQRIESISRTMCVAGNYEHIKFERYNFADDSEMFQYAELLGRFKKIVSRTEAYDQITKRVWARFPTKARWQTARTRMSDPDDFYVVYDSKDEKYRTEETILKHRHTA
jgi:hypothetical protein